MTDWYTRFLDMASTVDTWSKDPSSKVGCVLVQDRRIIATGFNGFPPGIKDDERLHDRETKYKLICHAEEAAILNCARAGVPTLGATLFVNWQPCSGCARKIIGAGIQKVVIDSRYETPDRWAEDCELGMALFSEAGVTTLTHLTQ